MKREMLSSSSPVVRIGTAGWSIPAPSALQFDPSGTHLQRYARCFSGVEINSSFHRSHASSTYARWRDSTPPDFRFAVKVPRSITHDLRLHGVRDLFVAFLAETDGLAEKRGPLLVQLPPSLSFSASVTTRCLAVVRQVYQGPMVWEPRHPTWFAPAATALLDRFQVSRVAADPPPVPEAAAPAAWPAVSYFRLHGSPRTYWSRYGDDYLTALAETVRRIAAPGEVWCVFDNTASGAAIENAWELRELLRRKPPLG